MKVVVTIEAPTRALVYKAGEDLLREWVASGADGLGFFTPDGKEKVSADLDIEEFEDEEEKREKSMSPEERRAKQKAFFESDHYKALRGDRRRL
jgi:hypothetical protein